LRARCAFASIRHFRRNESASFLSTYFRFFPERDDRSFATARSESRRFHLPLAFRRARDDARDLRCCEGYRGSNRGERDGAISLRRVGGIPCLQSGLILDYARVINYSVGGKRLASPTMRRSVYIYILFNVGSHAASKLLEFDSANGISLSLSLGYLFKLAHSRALINQTHYVPILAALSISRERGRVSSQRQHRALKRISLSKRQRDQPNPDNGDPSQTPGASRASKFTAKSARISAFVPFAGNDFQQSWNTRHFDTWP